MRVLGPAVQLGLVLILAPLIPVPNPAYAGDGSSASLNLNPRFDFITSDQAIQAERAYLGARGELGLSADFRAVVDGFGDVDAASNLPSQRQDSSTLALQEAFAEYKHSSFLLRVGRQPVRWSESWVVPSLDVWSGRRWNRLFFDPVSDQLTHPTGVLLSAANSTSQVEGFASLLPATSYFPAPLPESVRSTQFEWGFRAKQRLQGFDLSAVFADQASRTVAGGSVSYALDSFVPKIEGAYSSDGENFGSAGVDVFIDQWGVLPQLTVFHATDLNQVEYLGYLPFRYSNDRHTVELQVLYNFSTQDRFLSGLYRYSFREVPIELAAYGQNYSGTPGTLFGIYQKLTGEVVFGARIEAHGIL